MVLKEFNEIVDQCVKYQNIDLLEKFNNIVDLDPLWLANRILQYDQNVVYQWSKKIIHFDQKITDRMITTIAKESKHLAQMYLEEIYLNEKAIDKHFFSLLKIAENSQNYWFFKYGWDIDQVQSYVLSNRQKCNFIVKNSFEYQDYQFWETLVSCGLRQVISFNKMICSSLPTDTIIKYLYLTSNNKKINITKLLERDNIKLLEHARSNHIPYIFNALPKVSDKSLSWIKANEYPIIIPDMLASNIVIQKIMCEIINKGILCYTYTNALHFYQFIKPYYQDLFWKKIPDENILESVTEEHDQQIVIRLLLSLNMYQTGFFDKESKEYIYNEQVNIKESNKYDTELITTLYNNNKYHYLQLIFKNLYNKKVIPKYMDLIYAVMNRIKK